MVDFFLSVDYDSNDCRLQSLVAGAKACQRVFWPCRLFRSVGEISHVVVADALMLERMWICSRDLLSFRLAVEKEQGANTK